MHKVYSHDSAKISHHRSGGFTLIEVLVVIAIISVLFSLIGVATLSMLGASRVAATKATIVKVQGLLQQRMDAATRNEPDKSTVDALVGRFGNRKRAETMARKFEFRMAFPQTWAEIETYNPSLLTGQTYPAVANRKAASESAEVLLFILTKANVLGYPPEGVDVFTSAEMKDTDSNGAMELIDAWGKPLRFYRWSTRLVRGGPYSSGAITASTTARALIPSLPTTANDLRLDADDKVGQMRVNSNWQQVFGAGVYNLPAAQITYFENGQAPQPTAGNPSPFYQLGPFHTLETMSLPLIISGGPDQITGLYEPSDATNFGHLAQPDPSLTNNTFDDISNYNSRSGGK